MNIYQILETLKQVEEASWYNGELEDPKSLRWKQTSMSYEEAVAKYGADHVRKEGKARDGHEVIAVLVPLGPVEEGTVIPFNRAGNNPLRDKNDYLDKRDHLYKQLSDTSIPQEIRDAYKDRIAQLDKAAQMQGFNEGEFAFANPEQKPGDQVRGTEKATAKKSGEHPFAGRLVGAAENAEVEEEKTRLDAKCWKGYKKQGTKMKGDIRVNNCVPVEEEWASFVTEFGANNPQQNTQNTTATTPQQQAQELAKKTASMQQDVNKLQASGLPVTSVQQAVKTVAKNPTDPKTPMSAQDRQFLQTAGQEVAQAIASDDPSVVNQIAQAFKRMNQQSGTK